MRKALVVFVACLIAVAGIVVASAEKNPHDTIVFQAKNGNVTFQHKLHTEREGGKCVSCHDVPFLKDSTAPLNYKPHPKAEAGKTSCALCHVAGGKAFPSKGSCAKCHKK